MKSALYKTICKSLAKIFALNYRLIEVESINSVKRLHKFDVQLVLYMNQINVYVILNSHGRSL